MVFQSVTYLNPREVSSLGRKMKNPNPVKSKDPLYIEDRRGGKMDRYVSKMIDLRVHVKLPYIMPFQHVPGKPNDPYHLEIMGAVAKWARDFVDVLEYNVGNTMYDSDLIDAEDENFDNGDILYYGKSYVVYSFGNPEKATAHCDSSCSYWWAEFDALKASTNNVSWLRDLLAALRMTLHKMSRMQLKVTVDSKSRGGVLYLTVTITVPLDVVMKHAKSEGEHNE
jgi:predicted lipoprotein with Yx(FWY)xxD motif